MRVGTSAALKHKATPAQIEAAKAANAKTAADQQAAVLAAAAPAGPNELVMHRTPADKLPKQAAEQITSLETQLERCHAAMLASPTGSVCSPEQRTAIQEAAVNVARARPGWNLQPYQQEMAFYLAEDARRQQPAAPAAPTAPATPATSAN
ncbi:hypothetical protein GO988_11775 [Hymenobacter sp. HMF4947]|uniref:Uncharacterized protein n=1 Tax=Hymenobacter ginkgonis TaxID=2682976 RepID=A0A7K1TF38_9BACT|nr:hypothetical protein [Hymenobacter ginkgonis]MVN77005.1 hypothetical protein [Hymenobacter ginkgonis]